MTVPPCGCKKGLGVLCCGKGGVSPAAIAGRAWPLTVVYGFHCSHSLLVTACPVVGFIVSPSCCMSYLLPLFVLYTSWFDAMVCVVGKPFTCAFVLSVCRVLCVVCMMVGARVCHRAPVVQLYVGVVSANHKT